MSAPSRTTAARAIGMRAKERTVQQPHTPDRVDAWHGEAALRRRVRFAIADGSDLVCAESCAPDDLEPRETARRMIRRGLDRAERVHHAITTAGVRDTSRSSWPAARVVREIDRPATW